MGYELDSDQVPAAPVIYGETLFVDAILPSLQVALFEPTYDWLTKLDTKYTKRTIKMLSLQQAQSLKGPVFIKPVDEKLFQAKVYQNPSDLDSEKHLSPDTAVLISDPIELTLEIRSFICDRRIASCSAYLRSGEIATDVTGDWSLTADETQGALGFLEKLLIDKNVPLPPALVIDIGLCTNHEWVVVEANPCWGAGLCGCDPDKVLEVLQKACVNKSGLAPDLCIWDRSTHSNTISLEGG